MIHEFKVVCIPCSPFYEDKKLGENQVRWAFCKTSEALIEASRRLKWVHQHISLLYITHSRIMTMEPGSTNCPSLCLISLTVPSMADLTVCSIFMASMITRMSPIISNNVTTFLNFLPHSYIDFSKCTWHGGSDGSSSFSSFLLLFGFLDLFRQQC